MIGVTQVCAGARPTYRLERKRIQRYNWTSVYNQDDRQWILQHYVACPNSVREVIGVRAFKKLNVLDDDYLAMQEALIAEHGGLLEGRRLSIPVGED